MDENGQAARTEVKALMPDAIKIKATLTMTRDPKRRQVAERDMLIVRADGSIGIVKAGTELPVYDEKLTITETEQ